METVLYLRVIVGTSVLLLLVLWDCYYSQNTYNVSISFSNNIAFNNPTMMISGTCVT